MKRMLVSSAVVAGLALLGGGVYLWPKTDHVEPSAQVSSSVVTKTHKTTKKSVTKATTGESESDSSSAVTSSDKSASATNSQTSSSAEDQSSTSTTGDASSTNGNSQTKRTNSSADNSTVSVAAGRQLTNSQLDNWVWQQLATQYQGTQMTQNDFLYNHYTRNGLAYVDVYENNNGGVAHLAGTYRVNAQGNLEHESVLGGLNWKVVSTTPNN